VTVLNPLINTWNTSLGVAEASNLLLAIKNKNVGQGALTLSLEERLQHLLGVRHVFMTTSGSVSILMSLLSLDVSPGDEVIVPNRGWIAVINALLLLKAIPVIVDLDSQRPVLDINSVKKAITPATKGIIPVHMNGCICDMSALLALASLNNLFVIEDSAQSFMSSQGGIFSGCIADIGCFSLSMTKLITTGQGGFLATNSNSLAEKIRLLRTHGLNSVFEITGWNHWGFNFRFNDLLASIAHAQLDSLDAKMRRLSEIHLIYSDFFQSHHSIGSFIQVDLASGELPVYAELVCSEGSRDTLIDYLAQHKIVTRPFYPALSECNYLRSCNFSCDFDNSSHIMTNGLYLPSGTDMPLSDVYYVIDKLEKYRR
jgi:perosamine synthetase